MTAVVLRNITEKVITDISRDRGEPDRLLQRRLQAWQTYQATPLPGPGAESWRRTRLGGFDLDGFLANIPSTEDASAAGPIGGTPAVSADATGGLIVQQGGGIVSHHLSDDLHRRGVVFIDLESAARQEGDLFRRHFMTELVPVGESKFTALNAALWSGGAFVHIPPGVEVKDPLRYLVTSAGGVGCFDHVLIIAEAGSSLTFIQEYQSAGSEPSLHCGVVEIIAAGEARVKFACLQQWGAGVSTFTTRRATAGEGAEVEWIEGEFGGGLVRSDTETLLYSPGASSRSVVASFSSGRQHLDIGTGAVHAAPDTTSGMTFRGAAGGDARTVFRGLGRILRGAHRADIDQELRSLLLGPDARSDVIPSLLIQENDVKAGHAAAAGPLDPEQIYYLMSRGIPEREAARMMVRAFFHPLLDALPLEAVRNDLARVIDAGLETIEGGQGDGRR